MKEETSLTQIFTHEDFGEIRTIIIDGKIWFVGKDVAKALGYTDTKQAVRKHVKDKHKLTRRIDGSAYKRNMTLIEEAGLYTLIMNSELPAAEDFQEWVTAEVLPQIRQTGSYIPKAPVPAVEKIVEEHQSVLVHLEYPNGEDEFLEVDDVTIEYYSDVTNKVLFTDEQNNFIEMHRFKYLQRNPM